jgi:hypothetical protein
MAPVAPARADGCRDAGRATPLAALVPEAVLQRADAVVEHSMQQVMTAQ